MSTFTLTSVHVFRNTDGADHKIEFLNRTNSVGNIQHGSFCRTCNQKLTSSYFRGVALDYVLAHTGSSFSIDEVMGNEMM